MLHSKKKYPDAAPRVQNRDIATEMVAYFLSNKGIAIHASSESLLENRVGRQKAALVECLKKFLLVRTHDNKEELIISPILCELRPSPKGFIPFV